MSISVLNTLLELTLATSTALIGRCAHAPAGAANRRRPSSLLAVGARADERRRRVLAAAALRDGPSRDDHDDAAQRDPSRGLLGQRRACRGRLGRGRNGRCGPAARAFAFALFMRRQRAFVRSLGDVATSGDGLYRSAAVRGPGLVGVWRRRIVVPTDFEAKYSAEDRALILAHERAHLRRLDVPVNCIATLWLCVFWFNPLMYWAIGRLRVDQELACDAAVLRASRVGRRRYADALLRTQLADEALSLTPVACSWQSAHPLKERIAMLRRPLPTSLRRLCGSVLTTAVILSGGYALWAIQPQLALAQSAAPPEGSVVITPDGRQIELRTAPPPGGVLILQSGERIQLTNAARQLKPVTKIGIHADRAEPLANGGVLYSGNVVLKFSTTLDRPLWFLPDSGAELVASSFSNLRLNIFSADEPVVAASNTFRPLGDGSFAAEGLQISMAGHVVTTDRAVLERDGSIKADSVRVVLPPQYAR